MQQLLAPPSNAVFGSPQFGRATGAHFVGHPFRLFVIRRSKSTLLFDAHEQVDEEKAVTSHASVSGPPQIDAPPTLQCDWSKERVISRAVHPVIMYHRLVRVEPISPFSRVLGL